MEKMLFKRFAAGAAAVCCAAGMLAGCGSSGGNESSASKAANDAKTTTASGEPSAASEGDQVFTENVTGSSDGYDYELWKDTGDTEMTVSSGGTFSCKWSNINNALFRRGQKFYTDDHDQ